MILYFADKKFKILGTASTSLSGGYVITGDTKKEEVETGIATLDCTVAYTDDTRADIESWCRAGNYVLAYYGKDDSADVDIVNLFMITTTELSVLDHTIKFESEDSGLDLLNNLAKEYTGTEQMSAADYINKFLEKTGFRMRNNNVSKNPKKLEWTSTDTVTKRLADIAEKFEIELTYGFSVKGLTVSDRWVDIADETGRDTKINLYIDKEVNNITVKNTIENLATALYATGKDNLTLVGFTIPEEDKEKYQIDPDGNLVSLEALTKWKRVDYAGKESYSGNLYQKFESSDTTSQADLYRLAKEKLDSISDIETNYEVDIADLPPGVGIGDRVNIVDDAGNTYISGRILELETSVTDGTKKATLGEYVIKDSGISELVENLASSFANLSKVRELYTWIAYADTIDGDGFSFSPEGKEYLGTAVNQLTEEAGTDPAVYKWVKTKGEHGEKGQPGAPGEKGDPGEDGYSPTVDLSTGESGSTVLTVTNKTGPSSTELKDQTARNDASDARNYADKYINTDDTGTMVSQESVKPIAATKNNVLITEKDVQIRNGQKTVASYGSSVIIGNDEGNSIHIDGSGIDIMAEDQPLAKFGLSNATKYAPVVYDVINKNLTDGKCTGLSTYKINKNYANEGELKMHVTVKIIYHENDGDVLDNNAIVPLDEYHPNSYTLGIAGDHISITFEENAFQTEVKHFRPSYEGDFSDVDIALTYPTAYGLGMVTIGNRLNWPEYNDTGDFSLAIGTGNVADDFSMAIGVLSFAQAYSIACGNLCTAGANSCAFGYSNQAEQGNSFALGSLLHTDAPNQLVIGYKNKTTAEGITARFVVAGGSQYEENEKEPYNSAAITGDGDVRIKGDLYAHCNDDSGGGISFTKITSGTGTAKAKTGTVTMAPKWWRCGNLVQMEFKVAATASVAPGKNIATGTITGIPRPVTTTGIRAVSYYGDNANVSSVSQDGAFTVRNCGNDALGKGNDAIGNFTYITDGFILLD